MESGRRARQVLERNERSPAVARKHVTTVCQDLPDDVVDTARLLTSELVTNAVRHGEGKVVVTIIRSERDLCVEVQDDGRGTPQATSCDPSAEHGRGLALLDALSTDWGASLEPGTRVWFSLRTG